jgi:hypothetical protein
MSDTEHSEVMAVEVRLTDLHSATHKALQESAERNGRTIHEEAAHIIRTHPTDDEDQRV